MSTSSYTFDSPDADVILRVPLHPDDPQATEFKDFRVHKAILSTASTVFHDMFSLPQPSQPVEGETDLPIVQVTEPAEVFETFLRLIYPIKPPSIDSIQIADHLSQLAVKYMVECLGARLKEIIVSPPFLRSDPIWVYEIACRMGLDEEAELAIAHTYHIDLVRDIPKTLLQAMTVETYNRLLRSHATRRDKLISILNQNKGIGHPHEGKCVCGPWFYVRLWTNINLAIWERPILDRRKLGSCLSKLKGGTESECGLGSLCRVSAQSTSAYFAKILDAIEGLGQGSGS